MAYSRWMESRFYTSWSTLSGDKINNQLFEITAVKTYTFKQLTNNIDKCINEAIKLEIERSKKPVTKKEIKELETYMKRFIYDVIQKYKGKGVDFENINIDISKRKVKPFLKEKLI